MAKKQAQIYWHQIADGSKEITFIDGGSNQYHYGDKVKSMPSCLHFHVFIEY